MLPVFFSVFILMFQSLFTSHQNCCCWPQDIYFIFTLLTGINFQVVLGGPFLPRIEHILRDKAFLMSSPVVLASDAGNRSKINGVSMLNGRPFQSCDIVIRVERDLKLVRIWGMILGSIGFFIFIFIELFYWLPCNIVFFPFFLKCCNKLVIVLFLAVHWVIGCQTIHAWNSPTSECSNCYLCSTMSPPPRWEG